MAVSEPLRPAATEVALPRDRTLVLVPSAREDLVEIRAGDGTLELRIRLTEDGPVLELDSVRMTLRASESVAIETADFSVSASGEIAIASEGDVRVTGETIHLN